jgi:hypothetical protein
MLAPTLGQASKVDRALLTHHDDLSALVAAHSVQLITHSSAIRL